MLHFNIGEDNVQVKIGFMNHENFHCDCEWTPPDKR